MAGTPEGKVKTKVKAWLRAALIWFYSPVQMGMGMVGIPDLICCKPIVITQEMVGMRVGLFMAVEVKAPGKKDTVTPNQAARMKEIFDAGGIVVLVDDVKGMDELGKLLPRFFGEQHG